MWNLLLRCQNTSRRIAPLETTSGRRKPGGSPFAQKMTGAERAHVGTLDHAVAL